jgi:hypothetical protein
MGFEINLVVCTEQSTSGCVIEVSTTKENLRVECAVSFGCF